MTDDTAALESNTLIEQAAQVARLCSTRPAGEARRAAAKAPGSDAGVIAAQPLIGADPEPVGPLRLGAIVRVKKADADNAALVDCFVVVTSIDGRGVRGYVQAPPTADKIGGRVFCRLGPEEFYGPLGYVPEWCLN